MNTDDRVRRHETLLRENLAATDVQVIDESFGTAVTPAPPAAAVTSASASCRRASPASPVQSQRSSTKPSAT
jgi:hypothetical protein